MTVNTPININLSYTFSIGMAGEEMKYIFNLANSTQGLNKRCIEAQADDDKWKCNFAEMAYQYTKAPIFFFNSFI